MLPFIEIRLSGILHNLSLLKNACQSRGITLSLVTKVLGGHRELVQSIISRGGVKSICDSRVQNLKAFSELCVEKWLIRSPMLSEVEDVVRYADVSLNSERLVLQALSDTAVRQNKIHKVVLMLECGDLREGCYEAELAALLAACDDLPGIEVYGIGTNLSCLNEVLPSQDNMDGFVDAVNRLQKKWGKKFSVISGGASSSIPMLLDNQLPAQINSLRMGEAVFLGNIPVYEKPFAGAQEDNFLLKAEIIELKEKPSSLENQTALRKRAIVAVGKQDIYLPGLSCADGRMQIAGGSSDHIIVDVTDCGGDYSVGSQVSFRMNYNCLLNGMTSQYIDKKII